MPNIIFIEPNGNQKQVSAVAGKTLMETAVDNNVQGIVGECGGACQCATCHVYVSPEWMSAFPALNEAEDATLEGTVAERLSSSRLSCQLVVSDASEGAIVNVAPNQ